MIGVVCKYAPIEVLMGLDEVERLEVEPVPGCSSCLHPDTCSFIRGLHKVIQKKHIKKLVLTDCCDATRNLYEVLRDSQKMEFLYLLPLPHTSTERDIAYFARTIEKLKDAYCAQYGVTWDFEKVQQSFESTRIVQKDGYIRLTGAHSTPFLRHKIQEVFRDYTLMDETCEGTRYVEKVEDTGHFFVNYAEALLMQVQPCMRMYWHSPRFPLHGKPAATIFHTIRFCEYYGIVLEQEQENALPLVAIESEVGNEADGQIETRLEALKEEIDMRDLRKADRNIRYSLGIDCGSTTCEAVLMNAEKDILYKKRIRTGNSSESTIQTIYRNVLKESGIPEKEIGAIVVSGYGRKHTSLSTKEVTEITCHALGAHYLQKGIHTIIDIGGQDAKVICVKEGQVERFTMNDKCAAGTGRFLEVQAQALGIPIEQLGKIGLRSKKEVAITSTCSVFAESEVISLKAANVPAEDIVKGICRSVSLRIANMVNSVQGTGNFMLTGGVAYNQCVRECLEDVLQQKVYVHEEAQYCGAIGAALSGFQK